MEERLAKELLDAANNTGASVKKKKICTRWQKQTKHSHITDSNKLFTVCQICVHVKTYRRKKPWLEEISI